MANQKKPIQRYAGTRQAVGVGPWEGMVLQTIKVKVVDKSMGDVFKLANLM